MATDLITAAVPAALGTGLGYGLAFFIFKKTISKKYGKARKSSTHAKINFWCGLIAFIAIAQGFAGVSNEILYSLFNDSPVKTEKIFKYIFPPVIFSLLMAFISFVLQAIFKEKFEPIESAEQNEEHYLVALQEIKENRQRGGLWAIAIANNQGDNNKATADYIKTRVAEMGGKGSTAHAPKDKSTFLMITLVSVFIVIGIGGYVLSLQTKESPASERLNDDQIIFKKLKLNSCKACKTIAEKQGCFSTSAYQEIEIDPLEVTFKINDQYTTHPDKSASEVCLISKENGLGFECTKSSKYGDLTKINAYKYNGKNIFKTTEIVKMSASRTDITEIECYAAVELIR